MSESSSFAQISERCVRDFLHTIVVVDDRAFQARKQMPVTLTPPGLPAPDGRSQGADELGAEGVDSAAELVRPEDASPEKESREEGSADDGDYDLDAEELIRVFASAGMVCAVLEPKEPGEPGDILPESMPAAKRADALILDWRIHDNHGEHALSLIRQVLNADQSHSERLRLILIYTAEPELKRVFEQLYNDLTSGQKPIQAVADTAGLVLSNSSLRIAVLAKSNSHLPEQWSNHKVSLRELPARLVNEFSQLTSGLISNVALKSLSVLRDQTHTLLAHMGRELDAAYLTHRLLLPNPDDAIEYACDLVTSEFAALLQSFEVGNVSNAEAVRAWVNRRSEYLLQINTKDALEPVKLSVDLVTSLAINGIASQKTQLKSHINSSKFDAFHLLSTAMFISNGARAEDVDHLFTVASSTVRRYEKNQPAPWLRLGSILKLKVNSSSKRDSQSTHQERYLFCIQPPCDCVRLRGEPRGFLFVPAHLWDKGTLHCVVRDGDGFRKLQINVATPEILRFDPKIDKDLVRSRQDGTEYIFSTETDDYVWIGQLKDMHAQRLVNQFAASLARVGLNEYEWARRLR